MIYSNFCGICNKGGGGGGQIEKAPVTNIVPLLSPYISSRERPRQLPDHIPTPEQRLPQVTIHQQLVPPLLLDWAGLALLGDGMRAGDEEGTAHLSEQVTQGHAQVAEPVKGGVHVTIGTQLEITTISNCNFRPLL